MTLHNVVEEDVTALQRGADSEKGNLLVDTIEFLDHFDVCLDVVVGCARKIEMTRWARLFDVVGDPKDLFEVSTSFKPDEAFIYADLVVLIIQATEDSRILPSRTTWTGFIRRRWSRGRCGAPSQERYTHQGLATV